MDFLDELGLHQLWEKIKGLISSQTSNYAVDSAVVHIAGSETVTGPKTFSGGITVASGAVISGGAEVNGRMSISSGAADIEIPSSDPNDATKFLRGDGAWAEITSAASADTITTTLPISLGGTGESTKNMAVSALFNDNAGSNAAYLLGATSTFASAGYVSPADAKVLLGITQSDVVSMIGTEPVASATAASDAASLGGIAASNYVTLNTDQNITGIKTFVGQKKIKFQQSGASDKLGFTLYNNSGVEQGYLEYNPTNKINDAPLMTLGNYASAANGVSYVGFRKYSNVTGSAGAYNLLTPLIADARVPFNLTTTYSTYFLPLGVTDGTSTVFTDSRGVLDISALLPSGYTLPAATTTSLGGVVVGSGLDVTSTGDISLNDAYVSSAALDAVSSGGYIATSDAAVIIADQISSGGYAVDSSVVHISGNETITGHKTFSGGATLDNSNINYTISSGGSGRIVVSGENADFIVGRDYPEYGAELYLEGRHSVGEGGIFALKTGGGNFKSLVGSGNGTLTWGGKSFVYTSDDQDIAGAKRFTGTLQQKNTSYDITVTPSTAYYNGIGFSDKNDIAFASITTYQNTTDTRGMMFRIRAKNESSVTSFMQGSKDASGNIIIVCYGTTRPNATNSVTLGDATYRWKQLYANTATINTSDERQKTSISVVPDAVLDAWGDVDWRQFQMRDAVEEKGENARLHTGLIAQRIDDAFKAHGLDASRYGLFCHDEWDAVQEEKDENGNVIQEAVKAGDAYSLRYEEALCMEATYQRRRADRLEARLKAVEDYISQLKENNQ